MPSRRNPSTLDPRPSGFSSRSAARAGFTIIEIITALTIFMLIVAAIFETYTAVTNGAIAGNRAAVSAQRSRMALRTIEEALGAARSFAGDQQYYSFDAENGNESYLSFVSHLSPSFPRSGYYGDFNVRRVTFAVEAGPNWGKRLVLRQNPVLMDMTADEQNYPVVLANDVREFDMQFFDKQKLEWVDEWTQTNLLPQMIKFTLQLGGGDEQSPAQDEITRIVALPSMTVGIGWQMSGGAGGFNPAPVTTPPGQIPPGQVPPGVTSPGGTLPTRSVGGFGGGMQGQ